MSDQNVSVFSLAGKCQQDSKVVPFQLGIVENLRVGSVRSSILTALCWPNGHTESFDAETDPHGGEDRRGAETKADGDQRGSSKFKDFLRLYHEVDDEFIDDPVIEDLIQRGEIVCIYGASGVYKSAIVLDMGLHIAAGRPWCGRQTVHGFVCHVAAEAGKAVKGRLVAWRKRHSEIGRELPWGYVYQSVNLQEWGTDDTGLLAAAIKDRADGRAVQLVQIDTVSCVLHGAHEDRAEDMAKFIECLKRLSAELGGAAILFVHHTGKDEEREERGSYAIRANSDVSLKAEKDKASGISTVHIKKARDGEEGEFASFRAVPVEIGTTKFGKPLRRIVIEQCDASKKDTRKKVKGQTAGALRILTRQLDKEAPSKAAAEHGVPAGKAAILIELWRANCDRLDLAAKGSKDDAKRRAFNRARDELKAEGYIGLTEEFVWLVDTTFGELAEQTL